MNPKYKRARRFSVPNVFSSFSIQVNKGTQGNKYKKKINKTRTVLLLLMNEEYKSLLNRKPQTKINNKTFSEWDKEYNIERYIYLKPETISPINLFQRGEGQIVSKRLNSSNHLATGNLEESTVETNQSTPIFSRQSLGTKKLTRFSQMINPNEIMEAIGLSFLSINTVSENNFMGQSSNKVNTGFQYLRTLCRKIRCKKPRKISVCFSPDKKQVECFSSRIRVLSPK